MVAKVALEVVDVDDEETRRDATCKVDVTFAYY